VTAPIDAVADCPVGVTFALATTETDPTLTVLDNPVNVTGKTAFHAPSPQVPRPHPLMLAIDFF
jgi:hypothetical protein